MFQHGKTNTKRDDFLLGKKIFGCILGRLNDLLRSFEEHNEMLGSLKTDNSEATMLFPRLRF
jgi:hypothetical protein